MSVSHNIGYGSHYQKDSEAVEALSGHYNTSLVLNEIRIPLDYDFTKSTSDNYKWKGNGNPPFVAERQYVQDVLIDESYHSVIRDSVTAVECEKLEENWLVFTAGTMGAGKGYVLQWLSDQGLFPLESFVLVDPDKMRKMLPESAEYRRRDPLTAGQFTQKEVGFLSEILTMQGLIDAKNVLVDGSLRDAAWYINYVRNLRSEFPDLRVGIVYVTASIDTILNRVKIRAEQTGRVVPEQTLRDTHEQVPRSITLLAPFADVIVTFENEGGSDEPRLLNMSYWTPEESLPIVAPADEDYALGFSPPYKSILSDLGHILAPTGMDASPSAGDEPPSHSLSVTDLPHFTRVPPPRTEVNSDRKPPGKVSPTSWFRESIPIPVPKACPPGKLSASSSPASSLDDYRDMSLLLNGGLTARSAHSESSLDCETSSSGGFRRGAQAHGSGSGLQGLLRQSRRKTAITAPWERARLVRKPMAKDNIWWRDEFKALWEMRCKIPAFGNNKRTNSGTDDNS